ncbi:MAG: DUF3604 domain-containing protein [Armatimonadota bacterium]
MPRPKAVPEMGQLRLIPDYPVRVGEKFDITIIHTLDEFKAAAGDAFYFERRESRWISPQANDPDRPNYVTAKASTGAELDISTVPRAYSAYTDTPVMSICVEVTDGHLAEGDTITLTIHNPQVGQPVDMSTVAFPTVVKFFLRRYIDDEPPYCESTADLQIMAGPMEHLTVHVPGVVIPGEEFTAHIDARDAMENIAADAYNIVEVADGRDMQQLRLQKGTAEWSRSLQHPGVHYLSARDLDSNIGSLSNPVFVNADDDMKVYFGDIHGKVFFCGGTCDVDAYYQYARDVARIDFSAVTGVTELFRHSCTGYRDARPPLTETNWQELQQAAEEYTVDDEFAAFLSFEWQADWKAELIPDDFDHIEASGDRCYGDRNVYYLNNDEPFFRPFDEISNTAAKLNDCLRGKDALVIPHHTSAPEDFAGVGLKGADLQDRDDELLRLLEIYSKWGASEYSGNPRKVTDHSEGRFAQDALRMGHRMGFIGSSDTHLSIPGGPGIESTGSALRYYRPGYACVWAPRLTKGDIFEALHARRCYATTGIKLLLDFTLNDSVMGQELTMEPDAERNIEVNVAGTAPIEAIEVVRNGQTVFTRGGNGTSILTMEWSDDTDMRDYTFEAPGREPFVYYYIRVIQHDWEMAWSSPVWVDVS